MTMTIAYHVTTKAIANKIIQERQFRVDRTKNSLYGRGIYFWELETDAEKYGGYHFGRDKYQIIPVNLDVSERHSVAWDFDGPLPENTGTFLEEFLEVYMGKTIRAADIFSQYMKERGIQVIKVPDPELRTVSGQKADGKMFCYLIGIFDDDAIEILDDD